MKKLVSIMLIVVLFLNVSYGYTLKIVSGDYSISRTGVEAGTSMNFGLNSTVTWTVKSGGITPTRVNDSSASFTMPEGNVEIEVNPSYKVTASVSPSVASAQIKNYITPNGVTYVKAGNSVTYTFPAAYGRHYTTLKVNGTTVKTFNSCYKQTYKFTPTANSTIVINWGYCAGQDYYCGFCGEGTYTDCNVCGRGPCSYCD